MKARPYFLLSGVLFGAIAIVHLLRLIFGWTFSFAAFSVPMVGSVLAFLVSGALCYFGLKLGTSER